MSYGVSQESRVEQSLMNGWYLYIFKKRRIWIPCMKESSGTQFVTLKLRR